MREVTIHKRILLRRCAIGSGNRRCVAQPAFMVCLGYGSPPSRFVMLCNGKIWAHPPPVAAMLGRCKAVPRYVRRMVYKL